MTPEQLAAAVECLREQRRKQGFPSKVEDPVALATIVSVLREHIAAQAEREMAEKSA
jgi:hypothetical protein